MPCPDPEVITDLFLGTMLCIYTQYVPYGPCLLQGKFLRKAGVGSTVGNMMYWRWLAGRRKEKEKTRHVGIVLEHDVCKRKQAWQDR